MPESRSIIFQVGWVSNPAMYKFSVIVPVYNRPDEIGELLESLCNQTLKPYEILIIEDGSTETCEHVVNQYIGKIPVRYFFKENSGQGFSRNFGYEKALGDFLVVFDSDCIIPDRYFEIVEKYLNQHELDAFGGPDRANEDFTIMQKAISYSMTSLITTGGIRGNRATPGKFHPRSFNMGISRKVFESIGGFKITRMGEDIEFSVRIIEAGFKTGLIKDAFVYHKRRTSFIEFFKQLRFFGRARINVSRFYPDEIKFIHILPLLFLFGEVGWIVLSFVDFRIFIIGAFFNSLFALLNFVLAIVRYKSLWVALLAVVASFVQLLAYGTGLFTEGFRKMVKG